MQWVFDHTLQGSGIAVTNRKCVPYPEVTGYFIPTLRHFGERELALQYGRWLVSIQTEDGSWRDPSGSAPYTFDSGQILKGLLALTDISLEFEPTVRRGCQWLLGQVEASGRVTTPDTTQWVLPNGRVVPEAIHLYALEPLRAAASRWGIQEYEDAVQLALRHYLANPRLTCFDTLSHFHAYVVEALIDLGHREHAARAMEQVYEIQLRDGSVPAYRNVRWLCSTGLFQYAVIWYRLGERELAERSFSRACKLQNRSGGFYGSYGWGANYFAKEEISWAVKYFLDALRWKILSAFGNNVDVFPETIAFDDGRYRLIHEIVSQCAPSSVLDAGCGKGRFLRRLELDFQNMDLVGLDLSERMLKSLPKSIRPLDGSLLNIPCPDGSFQFVYCVEALEHAVNISGALRELARVLAPGGTMVIIDKNSDCRGSLKIAEWEQWFSKGEISEKLRQLGLAVEVVGNIPYDGRDGGDGLFMGWVARKLGAGKC